MVAEIGEKGGRESVEMVRAAGGEAVCVRTDVSEFGQVEATVEAAVREYGGLDVMFNNAGIGVKSRSWSTSRRTSTGW